LRKFISISAGGMAGAMLRYLIRNIQLSSDIPLGTLTINVVGSFLLAMILTLTIDRLKIHDDIKTGLTVGFFGAFTTFSSVCQESVSMLNKGQIWMAFIYIMLTTVLGMAAAYAGYHLSKRLEACDGSNEEDD